VIASSNTLNRVLIVAPPGEDAGCRLGVAL
jgi:hypothetical protein